MQQCALNKLIEQDEMLIAPLALVELFTPVAYIQFHFV